MQCIIRNDYYYDDDDIDCDNEVDDYDEDNDNDDDNDVNDYDYNNDYDDDNDYDYDNDVIFIIKILHFDSKEALLIAAFNSRNDVVMFLLQFME